MGSFAYTCAISGLPIEAGDEVRYFLLTKNPFDDGTGNTCYIHDIWVPRTIPMRAIYDDYGGVEYAQQETFQKLWREGFELDLIAQGWGDNGVHDVPTSKDMSFDELLLAVQEGRVLVSQNVESRALRRLREDHNKVCALHDQEAEAESVREAPPGVPTMERISRIIADSGLPLHDRYMVDELEYGHVRVRWRDWGSESQAEKLRELLPLLEEYAAVVAAGSGAYAHDADLLLRPKPGTQGYHGVPKREEPPMPVNHAMIREDVWQALLRVKTEVSLDALRGGVKHEAARRAKGVGGSSTYRLLAGFHQEREYSWIFKDAVPGIVALGTHLELMLEKGPIPEEVLDAAAEFTYIAVLLSRCRYQWRPSSSSGPQGGEWSAHERLLDAVRSVAHRHAKAQRRERRYDSIRDWWWNIRYRFAAVLTSLLVFLKLKKKEEDVSGDDLEDDVVENEQADSPTNDAPEPEEVACPSCQQPTKGSLSTATEKEYPFCAKCITRATPATDSWAAEARGLDPGPFTER